MSDETPFKPHRIHLAGHVDLGVVSARRDQSGTWEIEEDGPIGRRFIGPAAIYTATEIKPPEPLPEPFERLAVRIKGRKHVVRCVVEDFILFTNGQWMRRAGWERPSVEDCDGRETDSMPYSDDDIPF